MRLMRLFGVMLTLLLTATVVSCTDDEDDINAIFVSKTWYIHGGAYNGVKFTGDEVKSIYANSGTYKILFGESSYSAVLDAGTYVSGTWHADGKTNAISMDISEESVDALSSLGTKIRQIIKDANSYSGDAVTLTIKKDKGSYILLNTNRN